MKALTKILLRAVSTAALTFAVLSAPAHAQATPGPGATAGPDGASGGKHHKGSGQQTGQQGPKAKVDDKDYHSAIDRLPDQTFDPWHTAR